MNTSATIQVNSPADERPKKHLFIKHLLIALAVAGTAYVLIGGGWPVLMGVTVLAALQNMSRNRKELRADDATRRMSLSGAAPSGQAMLYVYREGIIGKLVGWNVSLDGTPLAQLRSPRFTQTTLSPGPHTLAFASEGKSTPATFDAQPGEVIVFALKRQTGGLRDSFVFVREQDTGGALRKLARIPLVLAERVTAPVPA